MGKIVESKNLDGTRTLDHRQNLLPALQRTSDFAASIGPSGQHYDAWAAVVTMGMGTHPAASRHSDRI